MVVFQSGGVLSIGRTGEKAMHLQLNCIREGHFLMPIRADGHGFGLDGDKSTYNFGVEACASRDSRTCSTSRFLNT